MDALITEFSDITNNQAYDLVFRKRLMLMHPTIPYKILGNTQRDDFLPYLEKELISLPTNPQIFDLGAGAGDTVDLALSKLKSATINFEEPNEEFFKAYKRRLAKFPHLRLGHSHLGPIQDLYKKASINIPKTPQNLISALHMIYFLSNYTDPQIEPVLDLKDAIRFMYKLLDKKGVIFLVYADQLKSITGKAARYYFKQQKNGNIMIENFEKIWNSRDSLLNKGQIIDFLLKKFPNKPCKVESHLASSYLYGKTKDDIVTMCLVGGLLQANDEPFTIEKLSICRDFLEKFGEEVGLTIEKRDVPQKNMFRVNAPQVITIIRRIS